ncbi:MAG: glycosyltransferase [Balneolaceae bacterium]|nr:glycosyltransferase [Balneolaceae bacterium]
MKVLHLSAYDISGGAARAAYRIHCGLRNLDIDSRMWVQYKLSKDPTVKAIYGNHKLGKLYSHLRPLFNKYLQRFQQSTNSVYHSANLLPSGLHRKINRSDIDIVHLHWINSEMISISEIIKIEKPVIWTLHDMWAFCGSEHYDDERNPGRYLEGYYSKNRPEDYQGLDVDKLVWRAKKKAWQDHANRLNFVVPSQWMAECFKKSELFKDGSVSVIHNGLDLSVFRSHKPDNARDILGLPDNKKIILFGAMDATSNPIKGYEKLNEAIQCLKKEYEDLSNLLFVVVGNDTKMEEYDDGVHFRYMGTIQDNITLSLIFSAANLSVVPSRMEAFGQMASESLACGTPVVAFNATGLKDIIDHKKNGYLAEPYSSQQLADGIRWVLQNEGTGLRENACEKSVSKFDIKDVSREYLNKYKSIVFSPEN